MQQKSTTKTGASRSFSHAKFSMQTKTVNIDQLHTIDGFATRYGVLKRGQPYKTQQIYNGIDDEKMLLTFHEIHFPVIQIDKVKLIVWDGKLKN